MRGCAHFYAEGTQDAPPHLRLHPGDGGGIQAGRRMEVHACYCVSCVSSLANLRSRLKYPIHNAAVKVRVFVQV